MALADLAKQAAKFAADNSPTILTAIGVTGALTTAFLTGKASFRAAEIIYEAEMDAPPLENREKVELVWKLYIPAIGSALMTTVCIVAANRIGTRRAAGLAAAYSLSEKAIAEYKAKVIDKMGEKPERDMRDELAQERINQNPPGPREVIPGNTGDVLCYDSLFGRYFYSNMHTLRKAWNDTTLLTINDGYASLSDFYHNIGLSPTAYSDEVGWNTDKVLDLNFSTCLAPDDTPCISVEYLVVPVREYGCLH